jgi:hypothetical protein
MVLKHGNLNIRIKHEYDKNRDIVKSGESLNTDIVTTRIRVITDKDIELRLDRFSPLCKGYESTNLISKFQMNL